MKQITEQSADRLLRRTALIQLHTGALTRDAASLSSFMATGGSTDYSMRFSQGAAELARTGQTPEWLSQKLQTRLHSSGGSRRFQREHAQNRPDLPLDPNREIPF